MRDLKNTLTNFENELSAVLYHNAENISIFFFENSIFIPMIS